MGFATFIPFNYRVPNKRDILLSDEEESIITRDFMPLTEARNRLNERQPRLAELIKAVENRNYVSIYYRHRKGKKGHRLIEPYAVGKGLNSGGIVIKKDKIYLRAFVIMNSEKDSTIKGKFSKHKSVSVSDKKRRWRLFRLDRIEAWTNMGKKFSQYRKLYNPNDKQLGIILASLPHSKFPKGENPKINF